MDWPASLFVFYYYLELWRREGEREQLAAELASEHSGVFERPRLRLVQGSGGGSAQAPSRPALTRHLRVT